ncbi:hypothetical protein Haur_5263 (plasmid) [Herpetosiphon aurantiacus DSM 785]|uniref:Uncharacterized protein n=1 Tax=Herpetosiphon aurantiacus (strain ATCC 23779 / DSM 785 / 114-95) TaxID=316274 RepID=A9B976_HERA2|nr:hypothetical protein Haur_5263 [Herpetosiphon aurantiacus DSM 785]
MKKEAESAMRLYHYLVDCPCDDAVWIRALNAILTDGSTIDRAMAHGFIVHPEQRYPVNRGVLHPTKRSMIPVLTVLWYTTIDTG